MKAPVQWSYVSWRFDLSSSLLCAEPEEEQSSVSASQRADSIVDQQSMQIEDVSAQQAKQAAVPGSGTQASESASVMNTVSGAVRSLFGVKDNKVCNFSASETLLMHLCFHFITHKHLLLNSDCCQCTCSERPQTPCCVYRNCDSYCQDTSSGCKLC